MEDIERTIRDAGAVPVNKGVIWIEDPPTDNDRNRLKHNLEKMEKQTDLCFGGGGCSCGCCIIYYASSGE